MPDFLLLSHDGAGLPLANVLHNEGHTVKVWIEKETNKRQYDGIVEKVKDWEDGLGDETIAIFDTVGIGVPEKERPQTEEEWDDYHPLAQQLIDEGIPVVGGGKLADRMELDRTWGAELAKKAGLLVPETHEFHDLDEALEFVRSTKRRYILKPHGNQETFKNYPARDWTDMVAWLEHLSKTGEFSGISLELQEFISGHQLSIEGWWTHDRFWGLNSTREYKPLLHGDLGPYTGETGSLVFYYPQEDTKFARDVLRKLEPVLAELHYPYSPLDVNCIVNEEGAWFLEFTARFGYPAFYIQLSSVKDDWGTVIQQMADGTFKGFTPKPFHWMSGARVWIPKWPFGETEESLVDAPLFSRVKPEHLSQIHFVDVYLNGRLRALGTDGELMTVTSQGNSIRETTARMYDLIHQILLYPMGYRDDIGENFQSTLEDFTRWGYWMPATQ